MKQLSILGSTGCIGRQTLEVVKQNKDKFKVVGLAVNSNIDLLKEQINEFKPLAVSVYDESKAEELRKHAGVQVFSGLDGLNKLSTLAETDTVVTSVVGSIGVIPTLNAIRAKKDVALANKETLVTAGDIIMREADKSKINLMPIDSEHSALFQCLKGEKKESVYKLILTCSGGSFRGKTTKDLKNVTVKEALDHPTWKMGKKITIDSATLMNKGFEVIEAHHLYNIPYEMIDVVVHPQSIVHSMVEFIDGSILAQIAINDMRLPIQYALSYPERISSNNPRFDFSGQITFERPDRETFKCLDYAYEAGRLGGTMPAVLNAANEMAVSRFLNGQITFLHIARIIKETMEAHSIIKTPDIEEIMEADKWARKEASR